MKIVVVGGGLSGYRCICALRGHYPDAEIVLVDKVKVPHNKTALADWLAEEKNTAFVMFDEDFLEANKVTFVNDIAVRVNFDRNRIFFKNEKSMAYDKLILACGLGSDDLSFPGQNKEGVCSLWDTDPFELKTSVKLYQNVVISVSSAAGLLCAQKMIDNYSRDFKLIITDTSFLSEEEKNCFVRYAADKGVEVIENTTITEAIGDTSLKAVKLSIGKFLVANILIYENSLRPELAIFKENEDKLSESELAYDDKLRLPNYDNVHFVGNLINPLWKNYRNYQLSDELRNASANYVVNCIVKDGECDAFDFDLFKQSLEEDVSLGDLLKLDLSVFESQESEETIDEVVENDQN